MTKKLTIIDGPDDGPFDDMANHDDASRFAKFTSKEEGEIEMECISVAIAPNVDMDICVSNNERRVDYNSKTKQGIMEVF